MPVEDSAEVVALSMNEEGVEGATAALYTSVRQGVVYWLIAGQSRTAVAVAKFQVLMEKSST